MARTSLRLKSAVVATALAGAALIAAAAAPASAANPPYDGCPAWALCLYQDKAGTGSKAIVTPPPAGGNPAIVRLTQVHFLNGVLADNQVSSWINNSQCSVKFMDDPYGELHPSDLDYTETWHWGATADYGPGSSKSYLNDRISSLQFWCP